MSEEAKKSKRIAKNTLVLYVRMMFLMLISLYTSRVILESLGVTDYGIYNVVGGFVAMFAIVSTALTGASSRFLNYEMGKGNKERLNTVFCSTVTVQYTLAIIIAILAETVGIWYLNNVMVIPAERLVAANWCFQFSVFNFCMKLITIPYNAAIIAHERMKTFAYVSLFEGIFKLIISYIILFNPFDRLVYYGLLLLLMQFVIRTTYQVYCRKNFEECQYRFIIDKPMLKQIFSYSVWHLFGSTSSILKNQGVNLLLNFYFGPVVNAAKGVANSVLHAVTGFATNFMVAVKPQITQSYARGDIDYMFKLVYNGARFSYFLLFFLSLPILVNADYIIHIWLKTVPPYAVIFAQLSLILSMTDTLSRTLMHAQDATGNIRTYQMVVGGILLLNLPLCFIFLSFGCEPYVVMYIALGVELLAFLARLYMIPRYIKEFRPYDYLKNVIFRCMSVSILSAIIPVTILLFLPINFGTFVLNVTMCLFISAMLILYIGVNREERCLLVGKIKCFVNKKFRQ